MAEEMEEFRQRAVSFLETAVPRRPAGGFLWGDGDDAVPIVEERDPEADRAQLAVSRRFMNARFDAGFGWIEGPPGLGGAGLTPAHTQAYRAAESGYQIPDLSYFMVSLGMVAPTVAAWADPDVAAEYLRPLYRGDLIACQLFSEPGAGSDLAALSTSAVRDGDDWVVTGQKVWTSNAHLADVGELICRTDPDQPKHRGLSAFLVDMRSPGVTVRPLRQMTGGAGFNEVFLEEVRVPDRLRLGPVNSGWQVTLTTLLNERAAIGSGMGLGRGPGPFQRLIELLRHSRYADDAVRRDQLARLYAEDRISSWTLRRGQAASGGPGPELSVLKLAGTAHLRRMAEFVSGVLGPALTADNGEWGTFAWSKFVCGVPGGRLGGGSDEVMRNILAERVLGLPKDPGPDPRTPFRDLPR
jgi:acyl-CoA dehydrogenase